MHHLQNVFKDKIENNEQIRNIFKLSAEASAEDNVWADAIESNCFDEEAKDYTFSLLNSSVKGYGLSWDSQEDRAKLGDIFGIISKDSRRLEVAIIRRISQLSRAAVQLGVEVVSFESESVFVTRSAEDKTGRWCILLPEIKALQQVESIVFKTGEFKLNEFVTVERNEQKRQCRIAKILNSTPSVL